MIIVTGAASGIGLATVRILLGAGSKVYGCDFNAMPSDDEALSSSSLQFQQCDLAKDGACEQVVNGCIQAFGEAIYGLCNVAGIMDTNNSADTLTDAAWEKTIAINLTAPVYMMRAVLPYMQKSKKGSIANVASKAGTSGAIAGVAYTASKHGLVCYYKKRLRPSTKYRDAGRSNQERCVAICRRGHPLQCHLPGRYA